MMEYKRLTNNNLDEYNPEYDFCIGCEHFGEPNGCNRSNGTCANYERFMETYNRLAELEDKIEQGTLIELPCIVVGNGAIDAFGENRVPYYQVLWLDDFGIVKVYKTTDKDQAEKRLKEIQE